VTATSYCDTFRQPMTCVAGEREGDWMIAGCRPLECVGCWLLVLLVLVALGIKNQGG
jgi:hypothetical protein